MSRGIILKLSSIFRNTIPAPTIRTTVHYTILYTALDVESSKTRSRATRIQARSKPVVSWAINTNTSKWRIPPKTSLQTVNLNRMLAHMYRTTTAILKQSGPQNVLTFAIDTTTAPGILRHNLSTVPASKHEGYWFRKVVPELYLDASE